MTHLLQSQSIEEFRQNLWVRYPGLSNPNSDTNNQYNSLKLRSGPLSESADICYYGCSFTYGTGVADNARWTNQIDLERNIVSNNFGIPGIGIEEIAAIVYSN